MLARYRLSRHYSKLAFTPWEPIEIYKEFMTPEKRAAIEAEENERKRMQEEKRMDIRTREEQENRRTLEAYNAVTDYAIEASRPNFVTSPLFGDITPTIPHEKDPVTGRLRPIYPAHLVEKASESILNEIQRLYDSKPPLHNPWAERDAFAYHPFFSFRNQIRYAFPGLKYATIAFIIYCIGEAIYNMVNGAGLKQQTPAHSH